MATQRKTELPKLKKIKAFGEEDYIELTINDKVYQMTLIDCVDTVDQLRVAYEKHIEKHSFKKRRKKRV